MSEEFNCENTIKSLRSTLAPDSIAVEAPTEEEIQQYILRQGDPIELESIELALQGNPVLWQQVQEMIEDHHAEQPFQWEPLQQSKSSAGTISKPNWLTLYRAPLSLVLGTAACAFFAIIATKSGVFNSNRQPKSSVNTVAIHDPKPHANQAPPTIDPNQTLPDKKIDQNPPSDLGPTGVPGPDRPVGEQPNLTPNPAVNNNGGEGALHPTNSSTGHRPVRTASDNRSTIPTPPPRTNDGTADPTETVVASGRAPRATLPTTATIATNAISRVTNYVEAVAVSGSADAVTFDQAPFMWSFDPNVTISWQGTDPTDDVKITAFKYDPQTYELIDKQSLKEFQLRSANSFKVSDIPNIQDLGPDFAVEMSVNGEPVTKRLVIHRYSIAEYTQMTNMLAEAPSSFEKARIYVAFHQYDKALTVLEGDQSEGAIELTKAIKVAKSAYENLELNDSDERTGITK